MSVKETRDARISQLIDSNVRCSLFKSSTSSLTIGRNPAIKCCQMSGAIPSRSIDVAHSLIAACAGVVGEGNGLT